MFHRKYGIDMRLRIDIYDTPFDVDKRFGFEWEIKTFSACPYGRYEKKKWCKTGFRLYYGSKKKHLTVGWDDSFSWCPLGKNKCC